MHRTRLALLAALLIASLVPRVSAQDAPKPSPVSGSLKPGQFLWHPEIAPSGPMVLVVSLDEQRSYVYRNGIAIGVSTISSGKRGHETPVGVFTILQKNKDHRSNLYNNAPMPWMQRLTWDGIALHGGSLPGYPASHGCVRLPHAFAEKLFAETRTGDTVVVANAKAGNASPVYPALLAPVAKDGQATSTHALLAGFFWNETATAPTGPVNVLVSLADKRVFVLRNGVLFAEAALDIERDFSIGGSVLIVVGKETAGVPSLLAPDRPRHDWTAYPLLGVDSESLGMLQLRLQSMPLQVDPAFARRLYDVLTPGTTLLLTDLPAVRPDPANSSLQPVLESDDPTPPQH